MKGLQGESHFTQGDEELEVLKLINLSLFPNMTREQQGQNQQQKL